MLDFGYFQLAKSAMEMSTHHQFWLGAVIVNKKPVSVGANLSKTHPIYANMENGVYSIHAEIKAILSCPESKLEGSEMWVYREKSNGSIGTAKPCEHCLPVIIEAGIERVYYTDEESPTLWEVMTL